MKNGDAGRIGREGTGREEMTEEGTGKEQERNRGMLRIR